MITRTRRGILPALATLFVGAVLAGRAHAMTVEPVVLDLKTSGHGMNQIVSVQNTGSYALPVELTVQELSVTTDGVHATGKDPGDLVTFPPQALIQPGQNQTFRVQYVGDPQIAHSKHYYVTVAQLPVRGAKDAETGVQVLYNLQVLVNVGPAGAKPNLQVVAASIGTNGEHKPVPIITVGNDSATYGYLARGQLQLTEKDESGHIILHESLSPGQIQQTLGLGLIASGQRREVTLPVALPAERGTLEAQFIPAR